MIVIEIDSEQLLQVILHIWLLKPILSQLWVSNVIETL